MNVLTLDRLARYIPDHLLSRMFPAGFVPGTAVGRADPEALRFILAFKELAFGWKFAKLCAETGLRLPALYDERDEPIYRAWRYCLSPGDSRDRMIQAAFALTSPHMTGVRTTIEALLCSKDASIDRVCLHVRLSPEVVRLYEVLFFNILDRKDDMLYLKEVVYPDGRFPELLDNYMQTAPMESMLRRAALNNGMDDALFMAGASSKVLDEVDGSSKTLESSLMTFATILARNGGINQSRNVQALHNARALITAGKLGQADDSDVLFETSLAMSIKDELHRNFGITSRPLPGAKVLAALPAKPSA